MNRRRFIRTAVAIAAALPVFGPLMRGQSEKSVPGIMSTGEIRDRLDLPPIIVSGWSPATVEIQDADGNFQLLGQTNTWARRIADEHLERYAHPVVVFEIDGQAVSEELFAELEAKARRRVGG